MSQEKEKGHEGRRDVCLWGSLRIITARIKRGSTFVSLATAWIIMPMAAVSFGELFAPPLPMLTHELAIRAWFCIQLGPIVSGFKRNMEEGSIQIVERGPFVHTRPAIDAAAVAGVHVIDVGSVAGVVPGV